MASRRPKNVSAWLGGNRGTMQSGGGRPTGIVDDIAKGIKDIASPWLPAAPGQNRSVTQAQGLARGAAETLDQTFAGGLVKAGTQGNKALAKQAAINAAALGTGYVAGKAIQTAVGAVVKSGVPAKITNKLTGQMVGVHGSPVSGLKTINPTLSQSAIREGYTNPQVYAANPAAGRSLSTATDYSQLSGQGVSPSKGQSGSVYIVKGKIKPIKQEFKKEFQDSAIKLQKDVALKNKLTGSNTETSPVPNLKNFPVIVSGEPFKVVKEFPVKNDLSTFYSDLKRYGAKLPKKK
jgi:hypothetical protein